MYLMKEYSVRVFFLLLKVSECFGISSKEKPWDSRSHFRSSIFTLQTRQPRPRLDVHSSFVCAGLCLEDDKCVGFPAVMVDKQCSLFAKTVKLVGDVWERYSASAESPPFANCETKPMPLQDTHKTPNPSFVSARKGSVNITILDSDSGTTRTWSPLLHTKGNIAAVAASRSSGEVWLCVNNPVFIYTGKLFQRTKMSVVFAGRFSTIGAFVRHKSKAYVSIGRDIAIINLLRKRLKYIKITTSEIQDTPLYHDIIQKKSILFWPNCKLNRIERVNPDTKTMMQPLNTITRLTCMTIDRNKHLIYVLSADGTISRLKDIGETSSARQPELLLRLPTSGVPGQRLIHHGNFLYITSPNKAVLDAVDIKKKELLHNAVSWGCSSPPPDVISIMD